MRVALVVVALLAIGCTGPEGPMGPRGLQGIEGAAGPMGPAGPAGTTKLTYVIRRTASTTGQVQTGTLPAAVGTDPTKPPIVACYLSNFQTGPWDAVNDGWSATAPYCWVVFQEGGWHAVMENVPSLAWAAFVIVY